MYIEGLFFIGISMQWYRLVVAYDGTDFVGWQQQPEGPSIEGTLKSTFLQIFNQKHIYLVGASRTDAGVHAQGQVVRIGTDLPLLPEKLMRVMNNALPASISITSCSLVQRDFHPQHQVVYKVYAYRVCTQRPSPEMHRYSYYYWHPLDMHKLNEVLQVFVGTHDFKAFAKHHSDRDTMRTIHSIEIVSNENGIGFTIVITGISFLQYMVRRMVGAAFAIASDKNRSSNEIGMLLKDSSASIKNLPKAPAKGLCLRKIVYQEESL